MPSPTPARRPSARRRRPPAGLRALAAGLPALGALAACSEPPLPIARGAVVISIDTLRADHLGAWGHEHDTSPALDRLAAGGVRFAECFSPTSWTLPSHLSLLTGLAISVHGVDDERLWSIVGLPEAPPTVPLRGLFLSEILEAEGFDTAGFYSWKYLEPRFGFGAGFGTYERIGRTVHDDLRLNERFKALRAEGRTEELEAWMARSPELFDMQQAQDDVLVDRGLAWIDGRLEEAGGDPTAMRPYFLFLHLFDPHDSYVPPAPFDAAFTDPDYDGPIDGHDVVKLRLKDDWLTEADLDHLRALYDGEIAWTDSQIQRFVDGLEQRGLLDDTVLSVTSDHGEEFFEHGAITHRANVYRETTHVPWILHWPKGLRRPRVVEGPTGLVDVAPTLLSLLGLDVPADLTGRDLAPVARGAEPNASHPYTSLVQVFQGTYTPSRHTVLRRDGLELYQNFERGERNQLDLFERSAEGEWEGRKLEPDEPRALELLAELDDVLDGYRRQREAAPPREVGGGRLNAAELAELQALGYATDDGSGTAELEATRLERLPFEGGIWPDR